MVFLRHDKFSSCKPSSRHLQDSSGCSENVLKTFSRHCRKQKTVHLGRQEIVLLKMSSRPLQDMPWRCLGDHQTFDCLFCWCFFSKNLALSMWIYYLVIHEIILWCLDLCSKALLRYLGQASETIYIALILHMLTYQNLWVTVLM